MPASRADGIGSRNAFRDRLYGQFLASTGSDIYTYSLIADMTTSSTGVQTGSYSSAASVIGGVLVVAFKEGTALTPLPTPTTDLERLDNVLEGYWRRFYRPDGVIVRPEAEGNGDTTNGYAPHQDTVSEAQAYGLIFAVQFDDQARFDTIEAWTYDHLDRRNYTSGDAGNNAPSHSPNLMAYHYDTVDNQVFDWAAAYDADIDRGRALLWAHDRWGSGGGIDYLTRALAILQDLVEQGLRQATYDSKWYMVSGTGNMSISEPEMNNSYLDPAAFRLFAQYDTTNAAKWLSAVGSSHDIIQRTADAVLPNPVAPGDTQTTTAKLPANWVTMNFTTGAVTALSATYRDTNHTYDAFRQTNRLLFDFLTYGDTTSLARLQDYKTHFASEWTAHSAIYAEYFHDGSDKGTPYESRMFAYAAWQVLTANDPSNATGSALYAAKLVSADMYVHGPMPCFSNSLSGTDASYYAQSWLLMDEMQRLDVFENYGQAESPTGNPAAFFAFF